MYLDLLELLQLLRHSLKQLDHLGCRRENGWVDGLPSEGPECPILKHSDLLRGVSNGAETFAEPITLRRRSHESCLPARWVEWGNMHLPATRVPRALRRMSLAFGAVAARATPRSGSLCATQCMPRVLSRVREPVNLMWLWTATEEPVSTESDLAGVRPLRVRQTRADRPRGEGIFGRHIICLYIAHLHRPSRRSTCAASYPEHDSTGSVG